MTIELADQPEEYGVSIADAQAIKQAVLIVAKETSAAIGELYELAEDLLAAFKAVDRDAFIHAEQQRKLSTPHTLTKPE